METRRRKIVAAGVVTLLLFGLVGCGVAASQGAQRGEAGDSSGKGLALGRVEKEVSPGVGLNARMWVVHWGYGFALTDDNFHVLRIHIVRVRSLQPLDIKGLMKSDKSIEEIRAEILEREGITSYQGQMRLGNNSYKLVNITVTENGDVRNFEADIVNLSAKPSATSATIGNISVTVKDYEGFRVGEGTLTMNDGNYVGEYWVLLQVSPLVPGLWWQQK